MDTWAGHSDIISNELADADTELAAQGSLSTNFPWSYSYLRSQVRRQLLQEWQTWHKPRDDFPFLPSTKLSAIFALPRHTTTRLFQMKLSTPYLLGHPNWHWLERGLCLRCEEEIETTEHALLRSPARQHARGPFPETLDLKSAWFDATAIGLLAEFVRRTLTACFRGPPPLKTMAPLPYPLLPHSLLA